MAHCTTRTTRMRSDLRLLMNVGRTTTSIRLEVNNTHHAITQHKSKHNYIDSLHKYRRTRVW